MFNAPGSPMLPRAHAFTQAYRSVGVETGVGAATPHQLVAMRYDGLLDSLAAAFFSCEISSAQAPSSFTTWSQLPARAASSMSVLAFSIAS